MAKEFHPDVSRHPNSRERFIEITEAYEYLVHKIAAENELRKRQFVTYQDAAQQIIDEWLIAERVRIRRRANEYASMRYKNFKNTKSFKATSILSDSINFGTLLLGIVVMAGSVVGTWLQMSNIHDRPNIAYYISSFLIFILGIIMTGFSAYQIRQIRNKIAKD